MAQVPITPRRRRPGASSPAATATPSAVQSSVQRDIGPLAASPGIIGGPGGGPEALSPLILQFASAADTFTPWGVNPRIRDLQLRAFWPTEEITAGAVYTCASRNASTNFALRGPKPITYAVLQMLHEANFGQGWMDFIMKVSVDLQTTDNGAFIEIIRPQDSEDSPVVGIAHLDSWLCRRTGNWEYPVIYTDIDGVDHLLKWYQVIALTEFPSPIERARGLQLCALSRVLRAAQTARDIAIYMHEKITGRFDKSLHLISGFTNQTIQDQMRLARVDRDNQGLTRFPGNPTIISNPDPTANIQHVQLDMATLPDGFDPQAYFSRYIAILALGFGVDYQDLAPLPGGNLGTSTQSQILHLKSRGKGPALFMKTLEHKFNFHGVVPRAIHFEYDPKDVESEKQEAELLGMQARALGGLIKALDLPSQGGLRPASDAPRPDSGFTKALQDSGLSGIDPVAWSMSVRHVFIQLANDIGIIPAEYLPLLGISDQSPSRVLTDSGEPESELSAKDVSLRDTVAEEVAHHLRSLERRSVRKSIERDASGTIVGVIETPLGPLGPSP